MKDEGAQHGRENECSEPPGHENTEAGRLHRRPSLFLGKDIAEAPIKGWEKYPGRVFYFVRIGCPAVHSRRGGLRRR